MKAILEANIGTILDHSTMDSKDSVVCSSLPPLLSLVPN